LRLGLGSRTMTQSCLSCTFTDKFEEKHARSGRIVK
jgi:hypothetical protein